MIVDKCKDLNPAMIENKHIHTAKVNTSKLVDKTKKPNTLMTVSNNIYPENNDILKKPVGKTHKCSYMYEGKKGKKKDKKKTKKANKSKKDKKRDKKKQKE